VIVTCFTIQNCYAVRDSIEAIPIADTDDAVWHFLKGATPVTFPQYITLNP
jgi:hypothetical protein